MGNEASEQKPPMPPQHMGKPVKQQRVQPRVAQKDLDPRSGGRVTRHEGADIFL
jgi:hypothetical protein